MAFEAYLQQGTGPRSRGRRITYLMSATVHGLAVLAAVAYSFWHVEEVKPPTVTVTFMSAAAAPPAPPPPPPSLAAGSTAAAAKPRVPPRPRTETPTHTSEVQQPKAPPPVVAPTPSLAPPPPPVVVPPREEPASPGADGNEAANAGKHPVGGPANGNGEGEGTGSGKGIPGGMQGGMGKTAPSAPTFLAPLMGARQKISGADPEFPTHLATRGAHYLVIAKVTVGASGAVETVTLLKRAHPVLDQNVINTLKTWRYRPLTANGMPVPFSTLVNLQFKTE